MQEKAVELKNTKPAANGEVTVYSNENNPGYLNVTGSGKTTL